MNEADFYSRYVQPCISSHGDCCRVENTVDGGMPDVNFAIRNTHGWLELKVVHSGLLHFEKFQLPWLKRRFRHSKDVWVLVLHDTKGVVRLHTIPSILSCDFESKRKWTVVKADQPEYELELKLGTDWTSLVTTLTHAT